MDVSRQLHATAALPSGKSRGTYRKGGWDGPRSWAGKFGEQKNSLPLQGKEPQMVQPLA